MRKILVTGGAGYIGSHVVQALVSSGDAVVTVDNLCDGHREAVLGGEFHEVDLADRGALESIFDRHDFDGVMHFAAHCSVAESMQNPGKYYRNNVSNLLNLLEVVCRKGSPRIIFSSTAAVYGMPDRCPIGESLSPAPINPYGHSKLIGENILKDFSVAHGLRFVALRYFNAAGADPSAKIGESHHPETHLIPRALAVASGRLPHVEIFGTDYSTADGTCIRDYVHVNDISRAHLLALERLCRGGDNLVANLGNSRGYSVSEIVRTAEEVTGKRIKVVYSPRRPGDPPELVCENAHAKETLGWAPAVSSLEEIIESAWNWELHRRY